MSAGAYDFAASHRKLIFRSKTFFCFYRVQLDQKSATSSFFGALAGKKLVRFQEYAALYPEATFIFVGDNGQVPTGPCKQAGI